MDRSLDFSFTDEDLHGECYECWSFSIDETELVRPRRRKYPLQLPYVGPEEERSPYVTGVGRRIRDAIDAALEGLRGFAETHL